MLKDFLNACYKRYGNEYDYSKVEYVDNYTPVTIICKKHGEFMVTPFNHSHGEICKECFKERNPYINEFLSKYHKKYPDSNYDFSESIYVNSKTKMKVICPKHGEFWMRPNDLLNGVKCPKCVQKSCKYTLDEFIEKAREVHGDKYDYSKVEYINNYTKVCIICPEHGEFWQEPREHLRGYGCRFCRKEWKLERLVKDFLDNHSIKYIEQHSFEWLKNKNGKQTLDFYLPDYSSVIECQGKQHFGIGGWSSCCEKNKIENEKIYGRDIKKYKLCEKNKIKVYYFSNLKMQYPYFVYEDLEKLLNDIINNICVSQTFSLKSIYCKNNIKHE